VLNILVVDAEARTPQDKMYWRLERDGHHIQVARSGKEAMELFKAEEHDVILLDMFLPDCMGYEVIPKFREIKPDIHIISMTAINTRDIESKNRLLGITYYTSKPCSYTEISSLINHISRQIRKEASPDKMITT